MSEGGTIIPAQKQCPDCKDSYPFNTFHSCRVDAQQMLGKQVAEQQLPVAPNDGLDEFLAGVKASCRKHAERKGYLTGQGNKLGKTTQALGIEVPHAIGEIVGKLIEFQVSPRKVIAEKIAGWAWRLWLNGTD